MSVKISEQPDLSNGALAQGATGGEQFRAFRRRVEANIGTPRWPKDVMQYYIQKPLH